MQSKKDLCLDHPSDPFLTDQRELFISDGIDGMDNVLDELECHGNETQNGWKGSHSD